jgi:hypothetical protein
LQQYAPQRFFPRGQKYQNAPLKNFQRCTVSTLTLLRLFANAAPSVRQRLSGNKLAKWVVTKDKKRQLEPQKILYIFAAQKKQNIRNE